MAPKYARSAASSKEINLDAMSARQDRRGSAVSMPSTSVQIWISSASRPAPMIEAEKSEPPRPSVVVTPVAVEPMKPPITTTLFARQRRYRCRETPIRFREDRGGLRVARIGDDHLAGIDMHRRHAEMFEGQRNNVTGEAFAIAGNCVDRARRQFAQVRRAPSRARSFPEIAHRVRDRVRRDAPAEPPGGLRGNGNHGDREAVGCSRFCRRRWRSGQAPKVCWWSCPSLKRQRRGEDGGAPSQWKPRARWLLPIRRTCRRIS